MKSVLLPAIFVALATTFAACVGLTPTASPSPTATLAPTPTLLLPSPTSTVPPTPSGAGLSTVEVVRKVVPSVVNIVTESVELDMFLRQVPVQGAGTGIVYDTQGHIVTNNHVVDGARQITVTLSGGQSYPARLVGGDVFTDLAVVQIDAAGLVPAQFGDSAALQVGEDVVAIGHAFNLAGGPTVTKGVISAKQRTIQESADVTLEDVIQTDAAINPGNSGGPLANMRGEVVGINSARLDAGEGLGFSIGINAARPVIEELVKFGQVQRAALGIQPVNVTAALAARYRLAVAQGIIVASVSRGSPAEAAGMRQGDVVVDIGGTPISDTSDLVRVLRQYRAGEKADVTFYRGQTKRTAQVTFASSS